MDATDVAAALLSALLHAGWNAAVKASPDPVRAMTAQMLVSAMIVLPGLLWSGLPDSASWAWIAASTTMNVVTVSALLRAYALGGFGIVEVVSLDDQGNPSVQTFGDPGNLDSIVPENLPPRLFVPKMLSVTLAHIVASLRSSGTVTLFQWG